MNKVTQSWFLDGRPFDYWAYVEKCFTEEECNTILQYGKNLELKNSEVGEQESVRTDTEVRKSQVAFFNSADPELSWVYRKLTDVTNYINSKFWNFNLDYIEILQFTTYTEVGDYYGIHIDTRFTENYHRKLSFSVQLSDSTNYEGGELKIGLGKPSIANKGKGDIIFFPSFVAHEVTPIIKGERYSLVGWICGPKFK